MALLGSLLLDCIVAGVLLFILALLYATSEFGFFKRNGIAYVRPLPFVGNLGNVILGKATLNEAMIPLYEELKKHKFGGIFMSRSPALLVCDPELVRIILTKDFPSVHDHGTHLDEENDPLSLNLFTLPGERWKNLRAKLSPIFTSGKLKQMFYLMRECSEELANILRDKAVKSEIVELKDYLVRYSTDIIGTCAFGIICNSLRNPKSEFYLMSQMFFRPSLITSLRFTILTNSKLFAKFFPFKKMFPNMEEFFFNVMGDSIKYRKNNNINRNDFVDLMMQLQKKDEGKTVEEYPDEVIFSDTVIASQAFFFFVAGLDAIATSVGLALHHLSIDTRLQDDLADEIHCVISDHDGLITYEGLKEMKLLGMIVSEVLRKYPPGGFIIREVTAPSYKLPGSDLSFKKGMKIVIPVSALHNDPDLFPEPEKFDPYRFTEEMSSKRHPFAYIPFSEGPRICIANRFALLEIKLCLASLIKDFKFSVCEKTVIPVVMKKRTLSLTPEKGIFLNIMERKI